MNWVEAAGFDFTNMAPSEMALARHIEFLRADEKLVKLFGGPNEEEKRIRMVPFGLDLDVANVPSLFVTSPSINRQPAPGIFIETAVIRDVIRFHSDIYTGDQDSTELWRPRLQTVISHLIGVVKANQMLNYTTVSHGVVHLASRVDLREVTTINLPSPQSGGPTNLFDIFVDWEYKLAVKTGDPRSWALSTVGE